MMVFVILAAFAASTVVHAASTTTMTLDMAMAADTGMEMADCIGCDDADGAGSDGLVCDINCVAPVLATLDGGVLSERVEPSILLKPRAVRIHTGRTGPPDPFPPKPLI